MASQDFYVTLKTNDRPLIEMNKRIEKLTLMEIWVMKASSLFERYHRLLDQNDKETDKVKIGINIEEIDICFMSSVSYFLRCFLNQKGSLNLEINNVTADASQRATYQMLMDLRNDEYVHWKGARSKIAIKYSFAAPTPTTCEFARTVQADYSETVGPDQNSDQIRTLFRTTLEYINSRRLQELDAMRQRLSKAEAWPTTNFYNHNGDPVIKKD
ncbi:hypothetical protein [Bdellovibrio bacteriovorus]|uniref:Uncharacterized protein n=1 Tax=Bdellovibrio bacteriovorus TaxID=959 RepID=A0A1Z3N9U4_BDEBC|nr:hypothetical protein [Bdellovibrio bacteriovorus]ASD64244.1 hypothetical protein B9G79_12035 [Bdellovibrio bacteriovorus]